LAAVQAATLEQLQTVTQIFDAEVNPVWVWTLNNTCDHYAEHLLAIQSGTR